MQALDNISTEIALLEAERDFGNITTEQAELLNVLNFCYDLLSRTQLAISEQVEQPEEMKEPGFEDQFVNRYGIASNYLADFVFALSTGKGSVSLLKLVENQLAIAKFKKITQAKIAQGIGIRPATISDYLNQKGSMSSDNIESILNFILKNG